MRTEKPEPDLDVLAEMGYEKRDLNMRAIGRATFGFFAFFFFSIFAAGVSYYGLVFYGKGPQDKATANRRMAGPPNPIVQSNVTVRTDMMRLRQREAATLASTGWANKDRTAVRIPIDRAIDILAERGLPKTGTFPANPRGPDAAAPGTPGGTGTPAGDSPDAGSPAGVPVPPRGGPGLTPEGLEGPRRAAVPNPPGNGR